VHDGLLANVSATRAMLTEPANKPLTKVPRATGDAEGVSLLAAQTTTWGREP